MPRDVFRIACRAQMSAEDKETGELMLYGEIVQDYGKYYKENYPDDKCASDLDKAVKELKNNGAKKLNLRINSPGGIVTEAVAMRAILTGANFESIRIRIEGLCASAATILASIPGAETEITPGSEYMIHNPWTIAWGNANDMQREVDHLRQLEATARGFYVQKSGQADEQIKEWMDAETWFTAEDAVKYGFCDKLAEEQTNAEPAAACVTRREMAAMKGLYRAVPEAIREMVDDGKNNVSNDAPVAGAPTENTHHEEDTETMDIKDLNVDQLRAENPGLLDNIRQEAMTAERKRCADIDDLTAPGYDEMAAKAKKDGTSAIEFHKQMVRAMKQKGTDYLKSRKEETAAAAKVEGGDPGMADKTSEDELKAYVKEMNAYAAQIKADDGSMF